MTLTPLFATVEAAIDAHPALRREPIDEVEFCATRRVWTARVRVSLKGSRKRPTFISECGDTPVEAADSLVRRLDIWAQTIA